MSARPDRARPLTLLVGAGRMGTALLMGWVAGGIAPITVVEPAPQAGLKGFARQHRISLIDDIEEARDMPVGACVIAIKPQILRGEARRLKPIAMSGALMLSIAAGTSIAALRKAWGRKAVIVRAMPNLPGSIGKGISALYAPRGTNAGALARAESLLKGLGETFRVGREELVDVTTAVSGSGPAYVFLFAECLAQAARAQGLPKAIAERLGRATVTGAGALLSADDREARALRQDVTSPGGTTQAALEVLLRDDALARLVADAVEAARKRAAELARESET